MNEIANFIVRHFADTLIISIYNKPIGEGESDSVGVVGNNGGAEPALIF